MLLLGSQTDSASDVSWLPEPVHASFAEYGQGRSIAPARLKCYYAGAFQALALQRIDPGWQERYARKPFFLEEALAAAAPMDLAAAERRLACAYHLDEVRRRQEAAIEARDQAFAAWDGRRGQAWVVSFKRVGQYVETLVDADRRDFQLGLVRVYPEGVGTLRAAGCVLEAGSAPARSECVYFLKLVDMTSSSPRLSWQGRDADGAYLRATLETPGFRLRAERLEVRRSAGRILGLTSISHEYQACSRTSSHDDGTESRRGGVGLIHATREAGPEHTWSSRRETPAMSTIGASSCYRPASTAIPHPRPPVGRVAPDQDIEHSLVTAGYCAVPLLGAACHVGLEMGELVGGVMREAIQHARQARRKPRRRRRVTHLELLCNGRYTAVFGVWSWP